MLGLWIHFLTANLTNYTNLAWVATSFLNHGRARNTRKWERVFWIRRLLTSVCFRGSQKLTTLGRRDGGEFVCGGEVGGDIGCACDFAGGGPLGSSLEDFVEASAPHGLDVVA